jgi:hypothetical protein
MSHLYGLGIVISPGSKRQKEQNGRQDNDEKLVPLKSHWVDNK